MKPFTEKRPWGEFRQFTLNEPVTVKVITVNKGEAFSLQYHNKRSEFWRIISGRSQVIVNDKIIEANPGDEFEIKAGDKHRMMAHDSDVYFLEVARGEFDESDIVRLEDKYGRK